MKRIRANLRRKLLDAIQRDRSDDRDEQELLGQLAAAQFTRRFNKWRILAWHLYFIGGWIAWDTWAPASLRFDPPPFIGLNLLLSTEAALAAVVVGIGMTIGLLAQRDLIERTHQTAIATRHEHQTMHRDVRRVLELLEKRDG